MALKFFLIPIANHETAEAELNAFLRSHKILKTERQLVDQGASSFWTICVDHLESANTKPGASDARDGVRSKVDYRQTLSPEDFAKFAQLRDLRKVIAQAEAIPVYTVFTNEQLATMVTRRAATKSDFEQIAGVGDARVAKYADRFLELLISIQGTPNAPNGATI